MKVIAKKIFSFKRDIKEPLTKQLVLPKIFNMFKEVKLKE